MPKRAGSLKTIKKFEKVSKMSVSDLDVCNLAFEGNLVKLKEEIEEKKDLIHAKDQVEMGHSI